MWEVPSDARQRYRASLLRFSLFLAWLLIGSAFYHGFNTSLFNLDFFRSLSIALHDKRERRPDDEQDWGFVMVRATAPEVPTAAAGEPAAAVEVTRPAALKPLAMPTLPPAKDNCIPMAICGKNAFGRLGNALFMLERALWLARWRNLCFVTFQGDYVKHLREVIDLPWDGVLRLRKGYGKWKRKDIECNATCGAHDCTIKNVIFHGTPAVNVLREVGQSLVLPFVSNCRQPWRRPPKIGEKTVVMQIRGGDTIFSRDIHNGWYPQPPCAYWLAVMERGNDGMPFDRALVITERWIYDPRPNPCIPLLQDRFKGKVTVQSTTVARDACTIMSAKHLALSFSTFGCALARLASNLTNVYAPFGNDSGWARTYHGETFRREPNWYRDDIIWEGGGMPYNQHVYTFPNFTCNWRSPEAKRDAMVNYDRSLVIERHIRPYELGMGPNLSSLP